MSNDVPHYAERVDYLSVFKTVERPSKHAPGLMARVTITKCPCCEREYPDLPVLKTLTCECGLSIRFDGYTHIWRDDTVSERSEHSNHHAALSGAA